MNTIVLKKGEQPTQEFDWGTLTWYANAPLTETDYTLGFCKIKPGCNNPMHRHPDSSETLCVLKGKIRHTAGADAYEMSEGDAITIPTGVAHNATNIGEEEAVLAIAFSTGERKTVNVK